MPEEVNLTPEQKSALAALSRGVAPGAELEDRVVADLRERGLLRRRGPGLRWQMVGVAAAAILLFVGGFLAGRQSTGKTKTIDNLADVRTEETGKAVTQVVWF